MSDRQDTYEIALQRILSWSEAYPLDIFPEPDWPKARQLLEAGGMTLDAVSAGCMRHVIDGVGKIARKALLDAYKVTAPWTDEQVIALNQWQANDKVHSFTCIDDHENNVLIATRAGWVCPTCDYTQDWAHDFMARKGDAHDTAI